MPKKQTIWLVSLLGLLVVLSAYYLLTDPVPVLPTSDMDVSSTNLEEPQLDLSNSEVTFDSRSSSVLFDQYRLEKEEMIQEKIEMLLSIISNTEASNEAIAEANRQLNELYALDEKQFDTEQMIKMEGYEDVVVMVNDNMINVVVKAEQLSREQALAIMQIVAENLDVGEGRPIKVTYKS